MVRKIDHINIVVADLEAAKKFFVELGFVVVTEGELQGEWIDHVVNLSDVKARYSALTLPGTQTTLELLRYDHPKGKVDGQISQPNQPGFRHMALEVQDIESVVTTLKQKGITFLSEVQLYKNKKKLCYFFGPEGILLELAEYLD